MNEIISKQKQQKEEMGEFDLIDERDFQNDFANEDYVMNNIRVRPISGMSKFDDAASQFTAIDQMAESES